MRLMGRERRQRRWECAERKTRGSSGIDGKYLASRKRTHLTVNVVEAVAILSIIRSESGSFPPSTVIIEQYRPPIGKLIVGQSFTFLDQSEPY